MSNQGESRALPDAYSWKARVRWRGGEVGDAGIATSTAYVRNNAFQINQAASFRPTDPQPDAVEYLLGALGGDLLAGFAAVAKRAGVELDALEASVSGQLNNPLVYLGVIGESGHAGFETIECKIYVRAEADELTLARIWQEVQRRSPLLNTLQRGVELKLELKITT